MYFNSNESLNDIARNLGYSGKGKHGYQKYYYLCTFFVELFCNKPLLPIFETPCFPRINLSLSLSRSFLGLVLRFEPQQGQCLPSQKRNCSHEIHLFCPISYLPKPLGFVARYLKHIPIQIFTYKVN